MLLYASASQAFNSFELFVCLFRMEIDPFIQLTQIESNECKSLQQRKQHKRKLTSKIKEKLALICQHIDKKILNSPTVSNKNNFHDTKSNSYERIKIDSR